MAKKKHTAEGDRCAAAEEEGRLREHLERSGPSEIHTAVSIARVLFGTDGPVLARQRKAAMRWAKRLRKLRYPLFPCDAEGTILSDEEADAQANRGVVRRWRYHPDGRWAREFGETLDGEGMAALADGLVALEESEPPTVFAEPRSRVLDGIRSILSLDEYRRAKDRFVQARAAIMARHRGCLVNQLSRTMAPELSDGGHPDRLAHLATARGTMQFERRQA